MALSNHMETISFTVVWHSELVNSPPSAYALIWDAIEQGYRAYGMHLTDCPVNSSPEEIADHIAASGFKLTLKEAYQIFPQFVTHEKYIR